MNKTFQLMVYTKFGSDKPDHTFIAYSGRQVVGLMKTIMDNFKPVHIDIIDQEKFNDPKQWIISEDNLLEEQQNE